MINESLVDNYSLQGAYIELTSECNLRCLHCYNESGVLRNLINMKEYENILKVFQMEKIQPLHYQVGNHYYTL